MAFRVGVLLLFLLCFFSLFPPKRGQNRVRVCCSKQPKGRVRWGLGPSQAGVPALCFGASQLLWFLQMEGKTVLQQKDSDSLSREKPFAARPGTRPSGSHVGLCGSFRPGPDAVVTTGSHTQGVGHRDRVWGLLLLRVCKVLGVRQVVFEKGRSSELVCPGARLGQLSLVCVLPSPGSLSLLFSPPSRSPAL